ncbi:hypothetical protein [Aeromonas veronii]|uniref:hypothetical protein n=1 Tax=Aeromonas veronii TaxID=654 RepID=UPI003BA288D3
MNSHAHIISSPIAFDSHSRDLLEVINKNLHLKYKLSTVKESLSAGYGYKSHAALLSKYKSDESFFIDVNSFDHFNFIKRLANLEHDFLLVKAISSIVDGARLTLDIEEQPENFQYSNTRHKIRASVSTFTGESIFSPFYFIMPMFGDARNEPYRIDSYASHRVDEGIHALTRNNNKKHLLTVQGRNGEWSGKIFIYDTRLQSNEHGCMRTISSALARRILASVSPRLNIELYRPDRYEYGAWRLKITLGDIASKFFSGRTIPITKPSLNKRLIHVDRQNLYSINQEKFHDGVFSANIYSNGIVEDENPTPINDVYKAFFYGFFEQLAHYGLTIKPYWAT